MAEKIKKPRAKKEPKIVEKVEVKEIPDNVSERKRSVNLENLDPGKLEEVSAALGAKCTEILERAKADCDKFLNVYGLKLRPMMLIVPLDFEDQDLAE